MSEASFERLKNLQNKINNESSMKKLCKNLILNKYSLQKKRRSFSKN